MKKRDRFWLVRILWIIAIIVLFIAVSLYNIVQLNSSYITEEKSEFNTFKQQVEWAIIPILESQNFQKLKTYSNNFKDNKNFNFRIFNENKELIISSSNDKSPKIASNDERLGKNKFNLWELYKHSFKDRNLEETSELNINNKKYFLEISTSGNYVINSIISAQKNIIFLFSTCLVLLILFVVQIFSSIRSSFNNFEDSVVQIAKGNLDLSIKIPRNGLLNELAQSVSYMTKKLKFQIERMKKLEEYKTEFIQNITHEIKTPITAINSAIEIIEDNDKIQTCDRECFDIIKNQINSINKLVEDILDLAETDLKKTEEIKNFTLVDPLEAIEEAIKAQGIISSKINIINKSDVKINANKKLLVMAISNLLSNSIKHSSSDKIDVIIAEENNHVILEIKDYGIGIDKKHLNRIFEKFYRIDKARSRSTGGGGLGLSIVKNITELHNWTIEVESKISQGSSFKIVI